MVNKKVLEKLSDKELELYIKPESKFVSDSKLYAFDILKSRNYSFSNEQIEIINLLTNERRLNEETKLQSKTPPKIILSPFIIVFTILGLVLFLASINYILINNDGGNSLGGVFTILGLLIIFFVLIIEQQILKHQNFKKENIWWVESIIILILFGYLTFNGFSFG